MGLNHCLALMKMGINLMRDKLPQAPKKDDNYAGPFFYCIRIAVQKKSLPQKNKRVGI